MGRWVGSGLLTCVCVCVCVFLVWRIQRGKKWFGIAAERTRRGMWLKMDKKDYHWEANWKWKQYLCGHTHLNCNGIFSMGTPSFISLFICSANINGCLASAKHSSRPPRHSDEKEARADFLAESWILPCHVEVSFHRGHISPGALRSITECLLSQIESLIISGATSERVN